MKSTLHPHPDSVATSAADSAVLDSLPRIGSPLRPPSTGPAPSGYTRSHRRFVAVPEPGAPDRSGTHDGTPTPTPTRPRRHLDRILVRKARQMVLVPCRDVHLIRASGNYVRIITGGASHLLRSQMSELAEQLDPSRFLRVHRSAIINTDYLEAVETNPAGDYFLRLPGDRRVKCSRSYRHDLREFLSGLGG